MTTARRRGGKRRNTTPVQETLLGESVPVQSRKPARTATNDPELVASVVRAAMSHGYVLIGPAQRVYLRETGAMHKGARVEPVPGYEQDAVRQLLDSGHLTTGGTHIVRHGNQETPASSVLVPKATQAMVTRWANLRPLHGTTRPGTTGPAQVVRALLWCPECGEPAIARPPTRWTAANGPRPKHSHRDGEPLCPVSTGQGYRPAQPVTRRPT